MSGKLKLPIKSKCENFRRQYKLQIASKILLLSTVELGDLYIRPTKSVSLLLRVTKHHTDS